MPAQEKFCGNKSSQTYHFIQGALFRALLKRNKFHNFQALTAAWSSWTYHELHPWLQENFTEESWISYAHAVVGRSPSLPLARRYAR